ncbi:MAG: RsiV family protein, partial [Paraprevotella sp.]|nr:RsiV family protein [Paraprevotella sp.]
YVQFKNVFESKQFVTYTSDVYEYAGGAHGSEYQGGAVFRKADGRKFGWDMFTADGKEKLRTLIEENLKKNYFKAANDSDFHAMLLLENADDPFPLPQTAPLFMPRGVQFIYQQYEIAPYAAGLPTCTLPYDKLKDLFTVTVKPLVESTTDSLAMSTYSRIDQSQKILPQSK